jgi:hypothetical protein
VIDWEEWIAGQVNEVFQERVRDANCADSDSDPPLRRPHQAGFIWSGLVVALSLFFMLLAGIGLIGHGDSYDLCPTVTRTIPPKFIIRSGPRTSKCAPLNADAKAFAAACSW